MTFRDPPALLVSMMITGVAALACGDDGAPASTASTGTGGGGAQAGTTTTSTTSASSSGAGGGGVVAEVAHRSGDRLRAFVLEGGPGAVAFQFFVDTALGAPCRFERDAAGTYRCLPSDTTFVGYADTACTIAVVRGGQGACGAPHFARGTVPGTQTCVGTNPASLFEYDYRYQVAAVAGPHAGPVYEKVDGGCTPMADPPQDTFVMGDVVDPEMFVAATEAWEPRGDRAEVQVLTAADGASIIDDVRDAATDEACQFFTMSDEAAHCLPRFVQYRFWDLYTDEACGGERVSEERKRAQCPESETASTIAISFVDDAAYELGASIPFTDVYRKSGSGFCEALIDYGPDFTYRRLGPRLPDDHFFSASRSNRGSGDLQVDGLTLPTGEVIGHGRMGYDAVAGRSCQLGIYQGEVRCIYYDTVSANDQHYADAACAQEVSSVAADEALPPVVNLELVDDELTTTCAEMPYDAGWGNVTVFAALHRVTPHDGPVYWKILGECKLHENAARRFFTVDAEAAPKELFQKISGRVE